MSEKKIVKIKRFDKELPIPTHQTEGAAAFDLTAREAVEILPGTVGYVHLNIAVETPPGYFMLLAARSSIHKRGLIKPNGIGIIDPDFCGDEDEIRATYYNFTDKPVLVEKGERIAQAIFVPIAKFEWDEVEKMENKNRGGFGTTGK
ncbi:MAG: dUTP diphosphatase [Candidatus Staskawiczbacteria bacterium]|nr:dUTP diphosphatase [Candidatus Staskawiczbacteria bacterium]